MGNIDNILNGHIFIAGPCSIESREHIFKMAKLVKQSGANVLRGGAFKPRTSPDSFQGLGKEAIDYLVEAKHKFDIPIITEIVDQRYLDLYDEVDIIQVGARNMQNFELLKALSKTDKPILLKRNMGATIGEMISASHYLRANGNDKILLCERGIRTFENATRYTFDVNAVAVLKEKTNLKVIVDPSHATGISDYVKSAALAGVAAGCDGLMIEVHDNPEQALTDKDQAISPQQLEEIIVKSKQIYDVLK